MRTLINYVYKEILENKLVYLSDCIYLVFILHTFFNGLTLQIQ
jgi:hypothetical protein